jgi:hypothetical protein
MKRLILASLSVLALATVAAPTLALNSRFEESHRDNLNSLNDRFDQERQETLNALNSRFDESYRDNLNS